MLDTRQRAGHLYGPLLQAGEKCLAICRAFTRVPFHFFKLQCWPTLGLPANRLRNRAVPHRA